MKVKWNLKAFLEKPPFWEKGYFTIFITRTAINITYLLFTAHLSYATIMVTQNDPTPAAKDNTPRQPSHYQKDQLSRLQKPIRIRTPFLSEAKNPLTSG